MVMWCDFCGLGVLCSSRRLPCGWAGGKGGSSGTRCGCDGEEGGWVADASDGGSSESIIENTGLGTRPCGVEVWLEGTEVAGIAKIISGVDDSRRTTGVTGVPFDSSEARRGVADSRFGVVVLLAATASNAAPLGPMDAAKAGDMATADKGAAAWPPVCANAIGASGTEVVPLAKP